MLKEVINITSMSSVWKEMEARTLPSPGGTMWSEILSLSLKGAQLFRQEELGILELGPDFTIRRCQTPGKEKESEDAVRGGARCQSGVNSIIAHNQ